MSKSTPISQLPAQQEVVTAPSDIIEDDATVQEVLNQISMGSASQPAPQQVEMPVSTQQSVIQSAAVMQPAQTRESFQSVNYGVPSQPVYQQQPPPPSNSPQPFYYPLPAVPSPNPEQFSSPVQADVPARPLGFVESFMFELRSILLVVIVTVVVQILPVDAVILRYAPLAKLPYANILAKAVVAGALFFIIRRYTS